MKSSSPSCVRCLKKCAVVAARTRESVGTGSEAEVGAIERCFTWWRRKLLGTASCLACGIHERLVRYGSLRTKIGGKKKEEEEVEESAFGKQGNRERNRYNMCTFASRGCRAELRFIRSSCRAVVPCQMKTVKVN